MNSQSKTIIDIAKELGISVSTVSRALRDTYDVKKETREKVLEMAKKLDYKPNFNAIGLVNGKSHNIGILLPLVTNYYFSTVITGIQKVAYENGYNIVLFITNDSKETEISIIKNISFSNIDGFLVSLSSSPDDMCFYEEVINRGKPIVFFDRVPENFKTSKVMQDDYGGAFEAVEHLIKQGYKKIAHISGNRGLNLTENRFRGYTNALKKYDIPVNQQFLIFSGFSQQCGYDDTKRLLKLKNKPDAIFAVNDRKAIGAMLAVRKKKIMIGRDFGIVGFTNDPLGTLVTPSLSTVEESAFDIGRISCRLLLKHINKKNFQPEDIVLPSKLIVRQSTLRTQKR